MKVTQVYEIMNSITNELIGESEVVQEDLSNIVQIGDTIQNVAGIDNYVKSLVDHIGKVIFVNRAYSGTAPSVLMDGWEYGSILEKVTYDGLPEATENESWELVNGQSYDVNVFTQPKVSAKFYNHRVTFEIPMSFAERQVKSAFDSVGQLNAFFSMIYNAVDKSMTVKTDSLIERTINNFIGETISSGTSVQNINLRTMYTAAGGTLATDAKQAIKDPEFIRFCAYQISLYSDRLTKISTLFNMGGKDRFTPKDRQHIIMLSEFDSASDVFLQSDVYHNELVRFPKNIDRVPYWQGSGTDYSIDSTSKINVKTASGNAVEQDGILAVMFDRDALGVSNLDRRVTTNWNAKGEFFNNWFKFDAGYFNDFNENFLVFHI